MNVFRGENSKKLVNYLVRGWKNLEERWEFGGRVKKKVGFGWEDCHSQGAQALVLHKPRAKGKHWKWWGFY